MFNLNSLLDNWNLLLTIIKAVIQFIGETNRTGKIKAKTLSKIIPPKNIADPIIRNWHAIFLKPSL